jgi:hypothetical protein
MRTSVGHRIAAGAAVVLLGAITQTPTSFAQAPTAQQQAAQQRVAALKQSMAASQQSLRKYEWVETTVTSHKGEEKSRVQKRVYYGADGKLTKTPLGAPPEPQKDKRGVRGKVTENAKDNIAEYMNKAVARIHEYVPPKPELIQKAVDAKHMTYTETEPGKTARVEFKDYLYAGDVLAIEMDLATNHMRGLSVATYIDDPKDAVTLQVKMADLTDGTTYSEQSTLVAAAKSITVAIGNAGYKPLTP